MDDLERRVDLVDDLIDRWHKGDGRGLSLGAYLGMTEEQYAAFVERSVLPDGYEPRAIGDDDEGEFDIEYPRTSTAERVRKVLTSILGVLVAVFLVVTFMFAVAGLAEYIGGPVE